MRCSLKIAKMIDQVKSVIERDFATIIIVHSTFESAANQIYRMLHLR